MAQAQPHGRGTQEREHFDERAAAALTECMTVLEDTPRVAGDSERFEVYSESGQRYHVDLRAEACDCPDCLHRGVTCKHIHRARFATGRAVIPRWVQIERIDPLLGRHVAGEPRIASPHGTVLLAELRERYGEGGR